MRAFWKRRRRCLVRPLDSEGRHPKRRDRFCVRRSPGASRFRLLRLTESRGCLHRQGRKGSLHPCRDPERGHRRSTWILAFSLQGKTLAPVGMRQGAFRIVSGKKKIQGRTRAYPLFCADSTEPAQHAVSEMKHKRRTRIIWPRYLSHHFFDYIGTFQGGDLAIRTLLGRYATHIGKRAVIAGGHVSAAAGPDIDHA